MIVQQRIGAYLETFDNLIENNQKQIKLLEEAAQRLYKEWFVDLRFPGYENCKIVDGVPVEWKKKKLDEIADVIMGQSPKSEFYNKEHKGLPFHQGVGSYGARFVQDDTYSTSFTTLSYMIIPVVKPSKSLPETTSILELMKQSRLMRRVS